MKQNLERTFRQAKALWLVCWMWLLLPAVAMAQDITVTGIVAPVGKMADNQL